MQFFQSDDKLLKMYGPYMPFLSDDRMVYMVSEIKDNKPDIQKIKFRNFRTEKFHIPYRRSFERNHFFEYRCFFTGSAMYLARASFFQNHNQKYIKWAASIEHLVARYTILTKDLPINLFDNPSNTVACGLFLNKLMSHMPLAIKLTERDYLHKLDFNREEMSIETSVFIRSKIIEFESKYWFVDNYPWFSHAIKDKQAKEAATKFHEELLHFDKQFLLMDKHSKKFILDNSCEIDVPYLAKKHLGIE